LERAKNMVNNEVWPAVGTQTTTQTRVCPDIQNKYHISYRLD